MNNEIDIKLQLEALISEREGWVTRRALYESMTADGTIMERRFFDEVETSIVDIAHQISRLRDV